MGEIIELPEVEAAHTNAAIEDCLHKLARFRGQVYGRAIDGEPLTLHDFLDTVGRLVFLCDHRKIRVFAKEIRKAGK